MTLAVVRRQVLSYRMAVHGLGRETDVPAELGVLDLGIQDTNVGSARIALAARLPAGHGDPFADPALTLLWSFRGAPHLHRTRDLARLTTGLWPISDADAIARLAAERAPLKAAGISGLEAFTAAAEAMRDVVTEPVVKGDVSAAVTARLPQAYAYWCRTCQATHVYGGLFQLVGPFAGVGLVPDRSPATLAPLGDRPLVPTASSGPGEAVRAYLRLLGPATLAEAASYLGTSHTAIRTAWPGDLTEVRVDGRRTWIPQEQVDVLRDGSLTERVAARVVRLLPPSDPYLQARDRDLLVPDKARRKLVWRMVANPGGVLVDGEVAGVWRARATGKARLQVTVQPFNGLPSDIRAEVEAAAERVAAVRGATDVHVHYEEA